MFRVGGAVCFFAAAFALGAATARNDAAIGGLYARGLAGDKQAVIDCVAALEQRLNSQPNDQLARVYLGSACTLRSRDLPFGPAKLSALRRGISLMDEAAADAPNDARVQLLRAITYESFPTILAHGKIAREALDGLVRTIEQHPEKLKPSDRELLYLNAGEAAVKAGDKARAHDLWRRGLALDADPKLSAEIRAALSSP